MSLTLSIVHATVRAGHIRFPLSDSELRERSAGRSYLDLLETLPLIVYSVAPTPPFEPLYISRGIEALGYTRDEWLQNPHNWVEHLHPDDRARIITATTTALVSGEPVEYEYRMIARDGSVHWFHDRGSFVRDEEGRAVEWRGVMVDQTARHAAEDALRQSESYWRTIYAHAPVGITVVDEDGRFLDANARFLEFLGYTLDELRQLHAYEVSPAEDAHLTRDAVRQLRERTKETVDVEKRFIRKTGEMRVGLLTLSLIPPHDKRTIVGMVQDVTERRQTEEALRQSREQLLQSQRMDMIGRLTGGIAHDFNNMLTVIVSHADFALAAVNDPLVRRDLEAIQAAANRAAHLTKQLLAFGRRQVLRPWSLDINALVSSVTRLLRRVLPEHVVLNTDLGASLPGVTADGTQLEQVLINIALNACDAMPNGGSLIVRTTRCHTQARVDAVGELVAAGEYVRISVEDTGSGMDEETRRRAFEPFFTTKPMAEGTGLGLSTVLGIVKQSGGFVLVDSTVGKGTSVHLHIPVDGQDDTHEAERNEP